MTKIPEKVHFYNETTDRIEVLPPPYIKVDLCIDGEVAAFSGREFILHPSVGGYSKWTVSDVLTGVRVDSGMTKRSTIHNARERLIKAGNKKVSTALRKVEKLLMTKYNTKQINYVR